MDYGFYLKNNIPDGARLEARGFVFDGQAYVLKSELKQRGLYAVIKISDTAIDVRVIDSAFDDDFIPFGVKDSQCPERCEVERLLDEIVAQCFDSVDIKELITGYMREKFGTVCERPWAAYPDYRTFKTASSKKWYAIIMNVKPRSIGLQGGGTVDIINVKADPATIPALIDGVHYFAAYHMNKKTWLTVLLDRNTDLDTLRSLVADSYALVEK